MPLCKTCGEYYPKGKCLRCSPKTNSSVVREPVAQKVESSISEFDRAIAVYEKKEKERAQRRAERREAERKILEQLAQAEKGLQHDEPDAAEAILRGLETTFSPKILEPYRYRIEIVRKKLEVGKK
ncbi:MAG: hypothetical protein ACXAB4_03275 [Candidatus Hodarchaeales archaeon]|jgi:hypothetical protein